jgi:hypothetical protein
MKKDDWNGVQWGEDVTLAEMIGTDAGAAQELLEKVTYDVYQGRQQVELVYTRLYNKTSDPNLPKTLTYDELGSVEGAFLQHVEGGEVIFGSIVPGQEAVVKINVWTLGFQFTKEFVRFNQTWRVTEVSSAFGEAYNKLLNHLHLGPITTSTAFVTTGGGVVAQRDTQKAGTPQLVAFSTDIATTFRRARKVLPKGTLILCNSFDTENILDALKSDFYADKKTPTLLNRAFNQDSFVEYDGTEAHIGGKTYDYAGVTAGTCYLAVPKSKNFRELEKQDLEVNSGDADVSRLILEQQVGETWRGVYCGLGGEYGVVKIMLA